MCDVSSPKTSCVAEVCAQTVLHRAILRAGSPAQYLNREVHRSLHAAHVKETVNAKHLDAAFLRTPSRRVASAW